MKKLNLLISQCMGKSVTHKSELRNKCKRVELSKDWEYVNE